MAKEKDRGKHKKEKSRKSSKRSREESDSEDERERKSRKLVRPPDQASAAPARDLREDLLW